MVPKNFCARSATGPYPCCTAQTGMRAYWRHGLAPVPCTAKPGYARLSASRTSARAPA